MQIDVENAAYRENELKDNAMELEHDSATNRRRKHTCFEQQLHGSKVVDGRRDVQRSAAVSRSGIRVCGRGQQQLYQLQMPPVACNVKPEAWMMQGDGCFSKEEGGGADIVC
jgi:hypothetical protein